MDSYPEIMKPNEVAEVLKVSRQALRNMVHRGDIKKIDNKLSKRMLFRKTDVQQLIERGNVRFRTLGSVAYYKRELDKEVGKLVRSRGACEKCGSQNNLQWAHMISRSDTTLRWDPLNALCLCDSCHKWQHKNPIEFNAWFATNLNEQFEYLQRNKGLILKRYKSDYQDLLESAKRVNAGDLYSLEKLIVGDQ